MYTTWILLLAIGYAWASPIVLPPDDLDLFEGDIMLAPGDVVDNSNTGDVDAESGPSSTSKRSSLRHRGQLFMSRDIRYVIDSAFTAEEISVIQQAINEFNSKTCIQWNPRVGNEYYVKFVKESGCWSYVGNINDPAGFQKISLGPGCLSQIGTPLHEMMHCVGVFHAQSRYDRNQYVEIMWENIQAGKEHNFNKNDQFVSDTHSLGYDFASVMHYGNTYFSSNGKATIKRISDPNFVFGQRSGFSSDDVLMLNKLYSCNSANGGWSEFSSYTPCDANCKKSKERFCMNTNPGACDANYPSGVHIQTDDCTVEECNAPVDGHYGRWSAWTPCSHTCGDGTQTRTRNCDDPAPKNGGANCVGESSQSQACNLISCGAGPWDCEFNGDDMCTWEQDDTDTAPTYRDWLKSGAGTPSGYTGPSGPRTGSGMYVYAEASSCPAGSTVRLRSAEIPATAAKCLQFYYYAYGYTFGAWKVYKVTASEETAIHTKEGSSPEQWLELKLNLNSNVPFRIVFELVCGSNYASDLCIDDIKITDGQCS